MVVVDAGLVVAILVPDKDQAAVVARFRKWLSTGEEIHAPAVLPYEILNVLARQVWDRALTPAEAAAGWTELSRLRIQLDTFELLSDGPRALAVAQVMNRRHATDCAYVALAERLSTDVWTLDRPFARAAATAGLPVQLVA